MRPERSLRCAPLRTAFRAALKVWRRWDWPVMWTLGIAALPLGLFGYALHSSAIGHPMSWPDIVYRTCQLYVLESDLAGSLPWPLALARFMAPVVTIYSVGRALGFLFDHQIARLRLRFWSGHVVVLGLGRKGEQLLKDHLQQCWRVVAIERNDDTETHRRCRDDGAIVIDGSATRKESLAAARVARASRVFVFCGSDDVNVDAVILSSNTTGGDFVPKRPVDVYVNIVDPSLCAALRRHALLPEARGVFRTHVVNTFENAARELFLRRILPLAPVAPQDPRRLRVIIVGFGHMGRAVATQIARTACLANEKPPEIVVVDERGRAAAAPFFWQHPGLDGVCNLTFIEARAEDPVVTDRVLASFADPTAVTVLVLCLDNDTANLVSAVSLRARIPGSVDAPPIFVRASEETGIGTLLEFRAATGADQGIVPFGGVADTCSESVLVERPLDATAKAVHADYVANRRKDIGAAGATTNDPSLAPWEELPEDLRDSNRQQADHIAVKLRTIGRATDGKQGEWKPLTTDDIELLARLEHHRWNTERRLAGWTLGPRDPARKTSPHLVSWAELDEGIREYDREAIRNLERLMGGHAPV